MQFVIFFKEMRKYVSELVHTNYNPNPARSSADPFLIARPYLILLLQGDLRLLNPLLFGLRHLAGALNLFLTGLVPWKEGRGPQWEVD